MELELKDKKKAKAPFVKNLEKRRDKLQKEYDAIEKTRVSEKKKNKISASGLDGLMERIHISHEIGGMVPWVIFFVLLSIEMGPIFFKMMITKGVYEYLTENNKKRFLAYNGIIIEKDLVSGKDGKLHQEKVTYMEESQELKTKQHKLSKQDELTQGVVNAWAKKQEDEIKNNPENFYEDEK